MKRPPFPAFLLLTALASSLACSTVSAAEGQAGFESFRFIRSRNIFDPDRRPGVTVPTARPTTASGVSSPRTQFLRLTGTMVTAEKSLAFFSGSDPGYAKVLGVSGKVGSFTVNRITPTGVELDLGGNTIVVPVGQSVTPEGRPTSAPPGMESAPQSIPSTAIPTSRDGAPAAAPSGSSSDVLRRMMEKRQRETSK